jgi:hypothetical protein
MIGLLRGAKAAVDSLPLAGRDQGWGDGSPDAAAWRVRATLRPLNIWPPPPLSPPRKGEGDIR